MKTLKQILAINLALLLLTSCLPSASKGGRKSSLSKSTATSAPTAPDNSADPLNEDLNFLQQGSITTTSTLSLGLNFMDSFFLRGNELHQYLRVRDTSVVMCFVAYFPTSTSNKLLVFAGTSQNIFNFTNGTREYYLSMQSTTESQNTGYCQSASMSTTLSSLYPGATKAYLVSNVCSNCTGSFTSTSIKLFDTAGNSVTDISLTHLAIKLDSSINANAGGSSPTLCSSNSDCESLGYNCCSSGQCVNDGQLKATYTSSSPYYSDYLQAIAQATAVPASFSLYPYYFYVCGINPQATAAPRATADVQATADALMTYKKELYDCTGTGDDERAVCTVYYPTAATAVASGTKTFSTTADDRNFTDTYSGAAPTASSLTTIQEIVFAGQTIYDRTAVPNPTAVTLGSGNDSLSTSNSATFTFTPSSSAVDKSLKIRFSLDGSCIALNSYLAQCTKYYVQSQATGEVDDHVSTSQYFDLPDYADTSRAMTVYVDGSRVYSGVQYTQTTNPGSGNNSIFFASGYEIQPTQKVKTTFYVNLSTYPNAVIQKTKAITAINTMCNCDSSTTCALAPVYEVDGDTTTTIVNYVCVYPTPVGQSTQPLQTTVYVNSKSVPVRYFDTYGVAKDVPTTTDPVQEGTAFSYTSNDVLRPNNTTTTIGFNEIYGSLNPANADAAQAPLMVTLVKNRSYDIFVDSGSFSQCQNCGTDYYSSLAKIFPDNFLFWAGGYAPDPKRTSRTTSDLFFGGEMRADDLLFGRACFLPATMIPWTHNEGSTSAVTNRRNRLAAQQFLFANGYQRDWYGFDYGALIGSYDGVKWFAIGNQRRIKAEGTKLFLAINAYFGDLTTSTTNTVTINEVTGFQGSYIDHDDESDGAQCRAFHFCSHDQDCVTQLGWDYVCEDVGSIQTYWPVFDSNGNEIPQSVNAEKSLASIVGGTNGQNKRCVYRGRGSPCYTKYGSASATASESFRATTEPGLLGCNMSNYCAALTGSTFNNSISRFGKSPATQNASSSVTINDADTFGLGARILGRPLYFNGTSAANSTAKTNLSANKISYLCIPGRESEFTSSSVTMETNSYAVPNNDYEKGDRVLNIGHTLTKSIVTLSTKSYYLACPTFDEDGDLYNLTSSTTAPLSSADWIYASGGQNISTKALTVFTDPALPLVTPFGTPSTPVTTQVLEPNRCMRAPGAACFTDWDCAPSAFIAGRIAGFDTASTTGMSDPELAFWQEDMICNNSGAYTFGQASFDLKKDVCCRDVAKNLTIATDVQTPGAASANFYHYDIPGIDTSITSSMRYTRLAGLLAKANPEYTAGPTTADHDYPYLYVPTDVDTTSADYWNYSTSTNGQRNDFYIKQWKSFDYIATNQCCTKNWVRNFDTDENGGGHTWAPSKMQNFDKTNLKCIDYLWADSPQENDSSGSALAPGTFMNCEDPTNETEYKCSLRNMITSERDNYSHFFSSLELLGIPQVFILTPHTVGSAAADKDKDDHTDVSCTINPNIPENAMGVGTPGSDDVFPIPGTIRAATSGSVSDTYEKLIDLIYVNSSGETRAYFNAANMDNFDEETKKIFDDDQVTCCLPTGVAYDHDITDDMCCTGKAYDDGDTVDSRCCLADYTNVSVYLNRFVSSEANYLTDEMFDPLTGAILDSSIAEQVARAKNMCCSGSYALGVAAGSLPVPNLIDGSSSTSAVRNRFIFSDESYDSPNNTYFDEGLRWPTDIYCVPAGVDTSSGSGSMAQ